MIEVQIDQGLEEAATLQALVDATAEKNEETTQTGVARSAEIMTAISKKDITFMEGMQERLERIVATILHNEIDVENLGLLTDEQLHDFMVEHLDQKDVERLIKVRYDMRRAAIFAHITKVNEINGVRDPEWAPGDALVPALNKRWTREGGKKKASLDRTKLKEALTPEQWDAVHTQTLVPAVPEHISYELDEKKLLALVNKEPKVMAIFSDCVTITGRSPSSLHTRNPKVEATDEDE